MKTTVLIDSHSKTVLDVQFSAKLRHDTVVGPQVVHVPAVDLRSLTADKGYDKNAFCDELRDNDVRALIH